MANLLKSLSVKNLNLNNRLVMPPMATSKSEDDGKISRDVLGYYEEKTKGGYIGLVIVEHSFVSKEGKANHNQLSIADDSMVDSLKELATIIKNNGSKAVMQINHAGSATTTDITGYRIVGPSAIAHPRKEDVPKELTISDIEELIEHFKNAALRVKQAGFDGVEIHSAHGYLLHQFFSPLTNKRNDEYGGDILGRIKVHLEIIKAVRETVGEDFPILLRLGASDYMEGGVTIADSKIAAVEFEKAGVDILDISGGFCGYTISGANEQGFFSPLTVELKKVISIPVILTGGITEADSAEQLLKEEKADLIGIGRAILKDSNWAKNAIESLR